MPDHNTAIERAYQRYHQYAPGNEPMREILRDLVAEVTADADARLAAVVAYCERKDRVKFSPHDEVYNRRLLKSDARQEIKKHILALARGEGGERPDESTQPCEAGAATREDAGTAAPPDAFAALRERLEFDGDLDQFLARVQAMVEVLDAARDEAPMSVYAYGRHDLACEAFDALRKEPDHD